MHPRDAAEMVVPGGLNMILQVRNRIEEKHAQALAVKLLLRAEGQRQGEANLPKRRSAVQPQTAGQKAAPKAARRRRQADRRYAPKPAA